MEAEDPALPESVLIITDRYPPHVGGLARSSQRVARHVRAAGILTEVLVLRAEGESGLLTTSSDGGIPVHRLGNARTAAETGEVAAQAIAWLQDRRSFKLFHGHYASTAGFFAVYHARLHGIASYVSLRGNDLDRDVYDPSRFAAVVWTLTHGDAVGAVSRALAHQAARLVDRSDVRYTPNAVDPSVFYPEPVDAAFRQKYCPHPGPIFGFAGELRQKKGATAMFEAFRRIADQTGGRLVLVGTVRPDERRALEQLLSDEPQLREQLLLVPYLHDAADLRRMYNLFDIVLCPSLREGMPNSILEALACGRPVLASDAGGIPDLIEHGMSGWVLSRHRLDRLDDALLELHSLPSEERAAAGERGRVRVVAEFSPERERRELLSAYAQALAVARARFSPGQASPDPHPSP
jgi:glycosyltransferase involved in cell wall biosynthesis